MPKPSYVAPSREGPRPPNRLREAGDPPSPQDRGRPAQHHGWPDHGDCHCQCPEEVCQEQGLSPCPASPFTRPRIPSTEAGAGARLHAAFLAGRSPHTLRAYGADLEAFTAYLGEPGPGAALSRLIGLPAGEGNGVLLAYRAHMIDAGLTPATINRRLAAIRSALKLARTLGLTSWAPEIRGLKVEAYRDTTGPGSGRHAGHAGQGAGANSR